MINSPFKRSLHLSPQAVWLVTLGIAAPAVVVAGLGSEVLEREPFPYEAASMVWLHAHTTPVLHSFSAFMNVLGGPHVTFPVMVLLPMLLWFTHKRQTALFTGVAFWTALALQWGLKLLFGRPRPDLWASGVHVSGLSFPSGHATAAAAMAVIFTLLAWRTPYRWTALSVGLVYAALMALSRVVLGVHYPTDVLAGMLTALFSVVSVFLLMRPKLGGK